MRFTSIAEVLADLQKKAENHMNKLSEKPKRQEEHGDGRDEYECPQCRDTELIIKRDEQGNEIAIFASVGSESLETAVQASTHSR